MRRLAQGVVGKTTWTVVAVCAVLAIVGYNAKDPLVQGAVVLVAGLVFVLYIWKIMSFERHN